MATYKRTDTLTAADLSKLSLDDRVAVMNMVKEGELTVEDAIMKLKGQTSDKAMTLGKAAKMLTGVGRGFNRRVAFRKNRGRLYLEIHVQRASAFSVVVINIKEGRDLLTMKNNTANPQVKVYLSSDPRKTLKRTQVRKNTLNPMFNEQFTFEVRMDAELDSLKLHIVVQEYAKLRRSQFMGSMAFSLAELFEEGGKRGWFRLLDPQKGEFQAVPFRPGVKEDRPTVKHAKSVPTRHMPKPPSDSGGGAPAVPAHAPPRAAEQKSATASKQLRPSRSASSESFGKVSSESFNYLKLLGQGSFGKVLLAEHKQTDEVFAIKVLKKEAVVEDDDVECTMIERRVLALSTGCPFLTKLVATFQTPERLYFVMEFINGGDLMFHIQKLKRFSLEQARFYTGEICLGLWFLHKNGVLYRDLKLDNVMIDHEGHIKIADFGMCKENIWGAATTTTFCGTPGYLAPEIIREQPYGASVDWWSLGVLVFEMLVGDSPFEGEDEEELFDMILHHKIEYPSRLHATGKDFIDQLLTRDIKKRLGCGRNGQRDIKGHPFFAGLDWGKLEAREVVPPYKPDIRSAKDVNNFDDEFTSEGPDLTPPDPYVIANIDQAVFADFSFVNKNYLKGTPEENMEEPVRRPALFDYAWYRPDLPREEAARSLRGKPVGTFFVRESSSQPGCYAIAMVSESNKIWNGLVTPSVTGDGRTLYKLFVKQKFDSLPDLIDYYCDHPVTTAPSGAKICLRRP